MNYNIPPIVYIRRFEPLSWSRNRRIYDMCLLLDSNFREDAQQIVVAAKILLLPLTHLKELAISDLACLDILRNWKIALVNDLKPELLQFEKYANFIWFELRKFEEFVTNSRQLFIAVMNYVPNAVKLSLRAPVIPCLTLEELEAAKSFEFYEEQREEEENLHLEEEEQSEQNSELSLQKMLFEDKFGKFLEEETESGKVRIDLERERAELSRELLEVEDMASAFLSETIRRKMAEQADNQFIERLVTEELSKLQDQIVSSAKALSNKKK